jgi:hypothetical protein
VWRQLCETREENRIACLLDADLASSRESNPPAYHLADGSPRVG